jgi:hypothetical protein
VEERQARESLAAIVEAITPAGQEQPHENPAQAFKT